MNASITIQNLPPDWQIIRLKRIAILNPTKREVAHLAGNTKVTFLPMEKVSNSWKVDYSETQCIDDVKNGYTYFRNGDVLVAKITPCFENGKGALVMNCINGIGFGTTEFHVIRATEEETTHYLSYVVRSHQFKIEGAAMMAGAAGQKRVPEDYVKDFQVCLPPLQVRAKIAQFLDRKTAEIDALIAKKQRLIELLEEKRSALINQAVTKGLDRSVRMKDSGIPWIGEIPEHWDVCELRRAWTVIDCKHKTPEYIDEGYPLVSTTEVKPGKIDLSIITRFISENDFYDMTENRLPRKGDIIYSRNASLGSAAYVDTDQPFAMGQDVVLITSEKQDQLFLSYFLNAQSGMSQVELACVGATFRRINVGQIKQILVTIPPLVEQIAIGEYLEKIADFYSRNVALINLQIEKLQEYRQSLITAAVTGKLPISAP